MLFLIPISLKQALIASRVSAPTPFFSGLSWLLRFFVVTELNYRLMEGELMISHGVPPFMKSISSLLLLDLL